MPLSFSPIITARRKVHSDGFSFFNLNERFFGGMIDPILNLDHFRMSERPFPPRPIAGFSAITAVLQGSRGGFLARDHLGLNAQVLPGGLYGLVSGSGMIAEETPNTGEVCEGIHVSVNLLGKDKRLPPRSFVVEPGQVREWRPNPQLRGRALLGRIAGAESTVSLPSPFSFFEFEMKPKMSVTPRVLSRSGGLIYLLRGRIRLSSGDEVVPLESGQAVGFQSGDKDLELFVESLDDAHFFFLSGKRCEEPKVTHGSFVMNTSAEIAEAIQRYQSGEMGKLDPSPE